MITTARPAVLILSCLLWLAGCSQSDPEPEQPSQSPSDSELNKDSSKWDRPPTEASSEAPSGDYARTPFRVLGVGETEWQGSPALAVNFSVPVEGGISLGRYLKVFDRQSKPLAGDWVLNEVGTIAYFPFVSAGSRYRVTVAEGLEASTGRLLESAVERWVNTRQHNPSVRFTSQGAQLSPQLNTGLEIEAVNMSALDLDLWRLDDHKLTDFLARGSRNWSHQHGLEQLNGLGELVHSGRFELATEGQQRVRRVIQLQDLGEKLSKPGVFVAVIKGAGHYSRGHAVTWFSVSDLGLHVRSYSNRLGVWAHGLTDAVAQEQVTIELLGDDGNVLASVATDQRGFASVDHAQNNKVRALLARSGEQLALVQLQGPALDLSEFSLSARAHRPLELFLYSPRDLYRPGEKVLINGLLRDHDGHQVEAQPVRVELRRPDGRVHFKETLAGNEQSFYTVEIPLPSDTLTGRWQFSATLGNGEQFDYPVQVEDFLPERMSLVLSTADNEGAKPFSTEDALAVQVQANYLWGAPAAGNRVEGELRVIPARKVSDAYRDFVFGYDNPRLSQNRSLPSVTLDDQGAATLTLPNDWRNAKQPVRVSVDVSVFESGGRPISRRWQQLLWPTPELVGVRPLWSGNIANPNTEAEFELIQIDSEDRLTGRDYLDVQLVREDRAYYWQRNQQGWQGQRSSNEWTVYNRVVALQDQQRFKLSVPVEYGNYRLELRDQDGTLLTQYRFFSGWRWDRGEGNQGPRPEQVALHWDAHGYRAGDTAKLSLTAPFDGQGLVTIEAQDLLWQGEVTVREGKAEIDIPVDARWRRHDIYATALVLRPGEQRSAELPRRAWGVRQLPLDRSDRKLQIDLQAEQRAQPETPLAVTVSLPPEQAGTEISVTLAAVDTGVLSLTNFSTPDPFAWLFGPRRYSAELRDTYSDLFEISDAPGARQRFGGDADDLSRGGDAPISDVQIVSLYSGKVHLDAQGRAQITLDLPYFNGELRLMALAFDDHRVGSADTRVTVAAPVVAEINLPRFLALGDNTKAVLDVQNMLPEGRRLAVEMHSNSALGEQSVSRTFDLSAAGSPGGAHRQWLRLPLSAEESQGQGEVRLRIRSVDDLEPAVAIERLWRLGLRPAFPAVRKVHSFLVPAGQSVVLTDPLIDEARAETLEASLAISLMPPLAIDDHLNFLLGYPYGCAEQTSSRLWPLVLASGADAARIDRYFAQNRRHTNGAGREQVLEQGFSRLAGMQRTDGGFGLWSSDNSEYHWVTVYIADLLLSARQRGHKVDQDVLDRTLSRIQTYLTHHQATRGGGNWQQHYQLAYRGYAALVLAESGQARLADVRSLYDHQKTHAQSPLVMAQLAMALEKLGDLRRAEEAWGKALDWQDLNSRYRGDYGSPVRDLAATLLLALESQVVAQSDQDPWALVLQLRDAMLQRNWYSTQEHIALYRLSQEMQKLDNRPWRARVDFAGTPLDLQENRQWSRYWRAGNWSGEPELENLSDKPLFVNFTVQAYPKTLPEPQADGITITREYFNLKGKPLMPDILASGEYVLVKLAVTSQAGDLPDALVVDLLPAGLELENQNLVHATGFADVQVQGRKVSDWENNTQKVHQEFRDDRYVAALNLRSGQTAYVFYLARAVTPGDYVIPPAQVEDMYRPELRASSASPGRMQVREPAAVETR